ncbi:GNA1162 family protein, partial [Actinobacillus pleuropneumoniae]
ALVALVKAAVSQVVDTTKDKGYEVSASAMSSLVHVGKNGGLLVGPRHSLYGKEDVKK